MKRITTFFLIVGLLPSFVSAEFGLGLPGVIKKRVEKIDKKVSERKPASSQWLFIDGEGSDQIDLFTATSQDADGFNLYRRTPDTSWQKLNTSLIPSDPDSGLEMGDFSDTIELTLGTTYIYQAKAVKNGQEISTSNEARVTFQGYYNPPDLTGGTPVNGATGVGVTPTFAWNGVAGAARYMIVVFDDEDLGWIKWIILTNGPVTSLQYGSSDGSVLYGPESLQQGTGYSWGLYAHDQYYRCIGESSNNYNFTP